MELLEQELYFDALGCALTSVLSGRGCIALVCGEPGVGKTSLIQKFVDQQCQAVRVLWGGCEALFTPQPLAPVYDIARQAGAELLAVITSATDRNVIFHATIDHLTRSPVPTMRTCTGRTSPPWI